MTRRQRFRDRRDAGQVLARLLDDLRDDPSVIVLALPRGGVPVAAEVAARLGAPLDVLLVRKLGVPGHEELAFGAISSGGVIVRNDHVLRATGLDRRPDLVRAVALAERQELERREQVYRGSRPRLEVVGRTVVLVDDGLATGASMRAAVSALNPLEPARVVVAVPTGSQQACTVLREQVDALFCASMPTPFLSVGASYRTFTQTTDAEVQRLLAAGACRGDDAAR